MNCIVAVYFYSELYVLDSIAKLPAPVWQLSQGLYATYATKKFVVNPFT